MTDIASYNSLLQMMTELPTEQSAINYFTSIRWKHGAFCPHCGSSKVYHFADHKTHKCGDCKKRFSIKVGTIFEDSKIGIRKWLMAIWLLTNNKKGIASTQLAKDIGVTQKTAWFMLHRLRHASQTKSFNRPLQGTIEIDETFIGGKEKNKHKSKRKEGTQGGYGKDIVLGMLERGGELVTGTIRNRKSYNLHNAISSVVVLGSEIITDEHRGYSGLSHAYKHHAVNHGVGEFVVSKTIHTNGIEGVWSLFKRQILGTHHFLSQKHLRRYLREMTWRFNRRKLDEGKRVLDFLEEVKGRLTYKELIA